MYYKTQGIILKKQDVGEADKILTIYTQDYGKIRCIAKGLRRPKSKLSGHLDMFNLVNLNLVQGRSLDRVTGCETVASFLHIKNNIDYTAQLYLAIEFFEHVIQLNQKDEQLYDLLFAYMRECDTHASSDTSDALLQLRMLTSAFVIKCLHLIGVLPHTDRCVSCHREFNELDSALFTNAFFEGFWCDTCARKRTKRDLVELDARLIRVIRFLNQSLFSRVVKLQIDESLMLHLDRLVRTMTNLNVQKKLVMPALIAELSAPFKKDIIEENL